MSSLPDKTQRATATVAPLASCCLLPESDIHQHPDPQTSSFLEDLKSLLACTEPSAFARSRSPPNAPSEYFGRPLARRMAGCYRRVYQSIEPRQYLGITFLKEESKAFMVLRELGRRGDPTLPILLTATRLENYDIKENNKSKRQLAAS